MPGHAAHRSTALARARRSDAPAADMATLKALRGKGRVGPHPAAVMR
jgi:hypothetical protein